MVKAKKLANAQPCAFCAERKKLRMSHVLPAFIYRWLRSSGHIRNTDQPDKRVQDGLKLPWLCDDCEKLFSTFEAAFATKLFHPWHNGIHTIEYGEWLLKFCVSVSWRVLRYARGRNKTKHYPDQQKTLMDEALERWRAFLVDEVPHPGQFEQHLLIFDRVESTTIAGLPHNFNRFMTRAVTLDIVGSDRTLMTFAKLGRFMVFGIIQRGPNRWEGTKVHVRHGVIKPGKKVLPAGLIDLFKEKAAHVAKAMDSISATQRDKIDQYLIDNLDTFVDSDHFQAIIADATMFGEEAILRKT